MKKHFAVVVVCFLAFTVQGCESPPVDPVAPHSPTDWTLDGTLFSSSSTESDWLTEDPTFSDDSIAWQDDVLEALDEDGVVWRAERFGPEGAWDRLNLYRNGEYLGAVEIDWEDAQEELVNHYKFIDPDHNEWLIADDEGNTVATSIEEEDDSGGEGGGDGEVGCGEEEVDYEGDCEEGFDDGGDLEGTFEDDDEEEECEEEEAAARKTVAEAVVVGKIGKLAVKASGEYLPSLTEV